MLYFEGEKGGEGEKMLVLLRETVASQTPQLNLLLLDRLNQLIVVINVKFGFLCSLVQQLKLLAFFGTTEIKVVVLKQ